jgi:hypothetical protein
MLVAVGWVVSTLFSSGTPAAALIASAVSSEEGWRGPDGMGTGSCSLLAFFLGWDMGGSGRLVHCTSYHSLKNLMRTCTRRFSQVFISGRLY